MIYNLIKLRKWFFFFFLHFFLSVFLIISPSAFFFFFLCDFLRWLFEFFFSFPFCDVFYAKHTRVLRIRKDKNLFWRSDDDDDDKKKKKRKREVINEELLWLKGNARKIAPKKHERFPPFSFNLLFYIV